MDPLQAAARLGAALAVGLLVGLERGWQDRERPEGGRVAGLRTFALIGLLGGLLNLRGDTAVPVAVGLGGIALLFAVSFTRAASQTGTLSITTAVAALVTFGLGALAASGQILLALGSATVVALLLDLKGELHSGIRRIRPAELTAVLQLGVLSAAVLPLLPDRGFGPYEALNPFRIWLAVILIAALSLLGHVAVRWRGPRQGLLWSGFVGGLASSTAATLALSRTARANAALVHPAAAGILASCGVMFLRMAVVSAVLQPELAAAMAPALLLPAAGCFAATAWQWRARGRSGQPQAQPDAPAQEDRPFDLTTAVGFGLLLGAVAVLARAGKAFFGDAGLYAVSFLSGLGDVDAPLVSSLHMAARGEASTAVALAAIGAAVGANMVVKAAMAWSIGGSAVGRPVAVGYLAALAAGAVPLVLRLGA